MRVVLKDAPRTRQYMPTYSRLFQTPNTPIVRCNDAWEYCCTASQWTPSLHTNDSLDREPGTQLSVCIPYLRLRPQLNRS